MNDKLPLKGLIVLEFSQFLAGPSAGLRLADLGARVIKIERPNGGDACRTMALKNIFIGNDSLLFHTINRNKESFTADFKNEDDKEWVKKLILKADVLTHNFRPGIMEKAGLDYSSVKAINSRIIYAAVTGYGKRGPWKDKPGQDLLIQSLSGLSFLSGSGDAPLPFGLSIADMICGTHLVQGILACLYQRQITGEGSFVEVSLLESILDFQFEFLTTWFNGGSLPVKSKVNNAHSLLGAPYGLYKTADGYLALAMADLCTLANALELPVLKDYINEKDIFNNRDKIKSFIKQHLVTNTNNFWKSKMDTAKLWCMPVMNWKELLAHESYKSLQMQQAITTHDGQTIHALRMPVHINNKKIFAAKPAPQLGQHTEAIKDELLNEKFV